VNNPSQTAPAREKRQTAPTQSGATDSRAWTARLVFLAAVAGAMILAWWSLTRVLAPCQQQSRELGSTVARLSGEVEDMERKWTKAKAEQLNQKFDAIHAELFGGPLGLAGWLANLKEQVVPLGLTVQADSGNATPLATNGQRLVVIPANIAVDVQPTPATQSFPSPYQRLLLLSQHLSAQEKRADLTELTVVGGTNSINRAVFGLNLWASEAKPQ